MAVPRLGAKVRALRRREAMTQARLAERLGISASYLNLIEHNKRPLPAALLIKLAQIFEVDLQSFAAEDEAHLESDLMEVFGDELFEPYALTNRDVRELVGSSPAVARSVLGLYEAYQGAREKVTTLTSRLADEEAAAELTRGRPGMPSEEVSDLIQRNHNYFPDLEEAAEALWRSARLDLNMMNSGLMKVLEERHGVQVRFEEARRMGRAVRRYDPDARTLSISEVLPPRSRHFQLAYTVGLLDHPELLDQISDDPLLTTSESRILARMALGSYFAGAVLMPYQRILEAARQERYDIELLGHRFRVSFEQVAHRLTCLQRPGQEGVPFYLIRIDLAGNISKKFSATNMRFPRFSGLCAKWNVFSAFLTPDTIRVQLSRMSESTAFFSIARTLQKGQRGYHASHVVHALELGCPVEHAKDLVYSEGVALDNLAAAVPVGLTCRLCRRMDCEQRAMPSIYAPLQVDENVRGESFYMRVED